MSTSACQAVPPATGSAAAARSRGRPESAPDSAAETTANSANAPSRTIGEHRAEHALADVPWRRAAADRPTISPARSQPVPRGRTAEHRHEAQMAGAHLAVERIEARRAHADLHFARAGRGLGMSATRRTSADRSGRSERRARTRGSSVHVERVLAAARRAESRPAFPRASRQARRARATPASYASRQVAAHTHQRSPGFRPGKADIPVPA